MADLDPVASVLVRGPMPLSQSAKIVTKVCELLAPMHDTRRAHGAISPENVFFRHVGGELTVQLRSGAVPSATYANPERARGRPEGPSSDIYSLGILFFHMITGEPPFDAESADQILEHHRTSAPPALGESDLQHIPPELEELVRSMMAKDPAGRPSARKVARDIDNLDLDSTVMGIRIQAALDTERDDPADADTAILSNVKVELGGHTDPQIVDPYADTLIKNRMDLGLDEELAAVGDTHLSIKKPTSGWNEDPTRILDHPVDMLATADADEATARSDDLPPPAMPPRIESMPPKSSRFGLLFWLGIVFFVAALVTAALLWVQ